MSNKILTMASSVSDKNKKIVIVLECKLEIKNDRRAVIYLSSISGVVRYKIIKKEGRLIFFKKNKNIYVIDLDNTFN